MNTADLVLYALCNALMVTAAAVFYEVRGSSVITLSHEPGQPGIESTGKIFLTLHGSGVGSHYNVVMGKSSQQPLTNVVTEEIFSPEEVMPHAKAPPRKQNLRGSKRRRTAILADSPERDAIYEEEKKREERKQKKIDRLSQKSKNMKKVYAQDNRVVKEKIQGEKAKEKTDRTLRSSKKNLEQSSSVSDMFCIIYLEPYFESASGEIWRQCIICKSWAHKCCVTSSIRFKCPNCQ